MIPYVLITPTTRQTPHGSTTINTTTVTVTEQTKPATQAPDTETTVGTTTEAPVTEPPVTAAPSQAPVTETTRTGQTEAPTTAAPAPDTEATTKDLQAKFTEFTKLSVRTKLLKYSQILIVEAVFFSQQHSFLRPQEANAGLHVRNVAWHNSILQHEAMPTKYDILITVVNTTPTEPTAAPTTAAPAPDTQTTAEAEVTTKQTESPATAAPPTQAPDTQTTTKAEGKDLCDFKICGVLHSTVLTLSAYSHSSPCYRANGSANNSTRYSNYHKSSSDLNAWIEVTQQFDYTIPLEISSKRNHQQLQHPYLRQKLPHKPKFSHFTTVVPVTVQTDAPVTATPAPETTTKAPAPVTEAPAPVTDAPAPVTPAPVTDAPAPVL
nr:cell wall adhesin EAP1-like [Penaeus vannamei]